MVLTIFFSIFCGYARIYMNVWNFWNNKLSITLWLINKIIFKLSLTFVLQIKHQFIDIVIRCFSTSILTSFSALVRYILATKSWGKNKSAKKQFLKQKSAYFLNNLKFSPTESLALRFHMMMKVIEAPKPPKCI